MDQAAREKNTESKKSTEKRRYRKAAILFTLAVVVVFLLVWFGREYMAVETIIGETPVHLNGQDRILKFTEKTNTYRMKNADNHMQSGIIHFAYFIELIDADSGTSLDKIRFRSPVDEIQNTPELIAFPDGTVWIVSTTNVDSRDRRGFILKFTVKADKIAAVPFTLDEMYQIRDIQNNKVILSEKNTFYTPYQEFSGGIYLDLMTGEIVDDRKE